MLPATRDNLPATRDLRRLDTVFTKLSSLGRLLLIHVFKLQVLVLVDEIYKNLNLNVLFWGVDKFA